MNEKVSISIVTYNSERYIKSCIESVLDQTYTNIEIILLDNNSHDTTIDIITKNFDQKLFTLIKRKENLGFCKGHNTVISMTSGGFVLVLNPDIILDKNFIQSLVEEMENHSRVGIISGKLLRKIDKEFTQIIDSTGIVMKRNRSAYDRGQGEIDIGQYDKSYAIFGACGAAAFYRKSMLEDIKINDEYFDNSFFAYKEDVDLSWRAKLLGWEAIYLPSAIAYHDRGWQKNSRSNMPRFLRVHSIKNRLLMIIKNESISDFLRNALNILFYEILVFGYCLIKEPRTLRYLIEFFVLLPKAFEQRAIINKKLQARKNGSK